MASRSSRRPPIRVYAERFTFSNPVAVLVAGPTVAGAPRSIEGRSPSPRRLPGHRWDGEAPGAKTPPLDRLRPRGRRCPLRSRVPGLGDSRCSQGDLVKRSENLIRELEIPFIRGRRCIVARSKENYRVETRQKQKHQQLGGVSQGMLTSQGLGYMKKPRIFLREWPSLRLQQATVDIVFAGGGGRRTLADN